MISFKGCPKDCQKRTVLEGQSLGRVCPYEDSNLDLGLRKAALYPLSYRDILKS